MGRNKSDTYFLFIIVCDHLYRIIGKLFIFQTGQSHILILFIFLVVLNDFTAKNAKFIAKRAMIFFCVLCVFLANFAVKSLKNCINTAFNQKYVSALIFQILMLIYLIFFISLQVIFCFLSFITQNKKLKHSIITSLLFI